MQEAAPPPKPPGPLSRFRWLRRAFLILLTLMTASLVTLSLIGGNSDSFRELFEDYLDDATGMRSSIGVLHKFSFYPAMTMDLENVLFYGTDENGVEHQVVRIGAMRFSIGFWSVATGRTKFRVLELRDADIAGGIVLPQDLQITQAGIVPEEQALIVDARYGGSPVTLRVDLQGRSGPAGIPSYTLAEDAAIDLRLGDIVLKGVLNRGRMSDLHLALEEFRAGDNNPVTGELHLSGAARGVLRTGESDFSLDMPFNIKTGLWKFRGQVTGETLRSVDIFGDKGLLETYRHVLDFIDGPARAKDRHTQPYDFSAFDVDLALSYKDFSWAGVFSGPMVAKLGVQNNIVTILPASPAWNGGDVAGKITLDATKPPGRLAVQVDFKGVDYTGLQRHVRSAAVGTGRADIKVDLRATGNNVEQFWSSLEGGIMAIAGPGELTSSLVNLWGGGLVNAMLPDFERGDRLTLHCGVGSFRVKGSVASAETILIDTDKVTIVGDGSINLRQGSLDLKLDPESKDTAFLSIATSVDVSGSWNKPRIRPETFSLVKRLGGLFLGTVNPAFLVFSMTDFGLDEKHPCKAYIKP